MTAGYPFEFNMATPQRSTPGGPPTHHRTTAQPNPVSQNTNMFNFDQSSDTTNAGQGRQSQNTNMFYFGESPDTTNANHGGQSHDGTSRNLPEPNSVNVILSFENEEGEQIPYISNENFRKDVHANLANFVESFDHQDQSDAQSWRNVSECFLKTRDPVLYFDRDYEDQHCRLEYPGDPTRNRRSGLALRLHHRVFWDGKDDPTRNELHDTIFQNDIFREVPSIVVTLKPPTESLWVLPKEGIPNSTDPRQVDAIEMISMPVSGWGSAYMVETGKSDDKRESYTLQLDAEKTRQFSQADDESMEALEKLFNSPEGVSVKVITTIGFVPKELSEDQSLE